MRGDKREAGKSYKEIHVRLQVPKRTLSGWFSKLQRPEDIRYDLTEKTKAESKVRIQNLNIVHGNDLARAYKCAKEEAR